MLNVTLEKLLKDKLIEQQERGELMAVAILVKEGVYFSRDYSQVKEERAAGADLILMWHYDKMPSDEHITRAIANVIQYPEYPRRHK